MAISKPPIKSACNSGAEGANEGQEQRDVKPDRCFADHARAQNIPRRARGDHSQFEREAGVSLRQSRHEALEITDEQHRIQRHLEQAAGKREPGFLETPEVAHAAAHPDVEAAVFRQGRGQLADHPRGRNAP